MLRSPVAYVGVDASDTDAEPSAPAPRRSWAKVAVAGAAIGAACVVALSSRRRAGPSAPLQDIVQFDAVRASGASSPVVALKPLELLDDGNVCDTNEELFGGLCYKKCSLLTTGEAPIRTSAWTCCASHPCTPFNEHGKVGLKILCTGYDIGGSGGCPHEPGACLVDEELYGGVCFEKCATLTGGAFPNRVGPLTCCDIHGLGCMNPKHSKTMRAFDVGGGAGDHDPLTLATAHLPQVSLTEDSSATRQQRQADRQGADGSAAVAPALKPSEVMHDGNVCGDDEELYGGLCYRRCSLLTEGRAAIRTSSWTCCDAHPCAPWRQHGSLGSKVLCSGYDISGDGSCPHRPGACLLDEELYLGMCFKRCSLLTDGAYPHRVAPATCCRSGGLGCLNLRNDRTERSFDVGGGAGDSDPSTPAEAHAPMQELTEGRRSGGEELMLHRRLRSGAAA